MVSAAKRRFPADRKARRPRPDELKSQILAWLDDAKAEDLVEIDLTGKSSMGDVMIVASGRADRHVRAIAQRVIDELKNCGAGTARVEGMPHCDWVLIDVGSIIVHVFRPDVRAFYNLEKMWSGEPMPEHLDS